MPDEQTGSRDLLTNLSRADSPDAKWDVPPAQDRQGTATPGELFVPETRSGKQGDAVVMEETTKSKSKSEE